MRKKAFTMATGHFFFTVKMGYQNDITISRQTQEEAVRTYKMYLKQNKDCQWLGQWNGKKFVKTDIKAA